MRIVSLSLVLATIVTLVHSQTVFEASIMGRHAWGDDGSVQFDHPGIVTAIQWMGGVTQVSVVMSMVQGNASSTSVKVSTPSPAPTPASVYESNWFGAFLFAGYNKPLSRPPPLDQAIATMNFTTESWEPNSLMRIKLFDGLDASIAWSVYLIKMTEADFNQPWFGPNFVTLHHYETSAAKSETTLSSVRRILPVSRSANEEQAPTPPTRRRRIEFVGDSITAGYCSLCGENGNSFSAEDISLSWGYRTAEHFDADYHIEAWAGYGVLRNYAGGVTFMPEIFQRTLATVDQQNWNFSTWVPDILVINLGTNDGLDPQNPGPFEKEWVARFTQFLNHTIMERYPVSVRDNANQSLSVYLACGPMMSAAQCVFVVESAALLAPDMTANTKVNFLNFAGALTSNQTCCGHPSGHVGDVILANITIHRIQATDGWTTLKS